VLYLCLNLKRFDQLYALLHALPQPQRPVKETVPAIKPNASRAKKQSAVSAASTALSFSAAPTVAAKQDTVIPVDIRAMLPAIIGEILLQLELAITPSVTNTTKKRRASASDSYDYESSEDESTSAYTEDPEQISREKSLMSMMKFLAVYLLADLMQVHFSDYVPTKKAATGTSMINMLSSRGSDSSCRTP